MNCTRSPSLAAASRFGLRPTRVAASKDLHHFLGLNRAVVTSNGAFDALTPLRPKPTASPLRKALRELKLHVEDPL